LFVDTSILGPPSEFNVTWPDGYDERVIELELRRGAVTIKLLWPMSAAAELAAFTRESLR
jgi:transposase